MNLIYEDNTGFEDGDGNILEVGVNTSSRSDNNVYLSIHNYENNSIEPSTSLVGEDKIKAFLYQVAYDGSLNDEDEEITISKPKDPKVVPEDGIYLASVGIDKFYAVVENGRVLVPQENLNGTPIGQANDQTYSYLSRENFVLTPIKITRRDF